MDMFVYAFIVGVVIWALGMAITDKDDDFDYSEYRDHF